MKTFSSDNEDLSTLLSSIKDGKTQLPDFQRGWVWNHENIQSLLASVSLSYPIGAVMMLETGNPDMQFKTRLVEGVKPLANLPKPDRLIQDGQQRLTSLFQALLSGEPVVTKESRGKEIPRRYYLDIAKALAPNTDREDAILGLSEAQIVRTFGHQPQDDYLTLEKECTKGLLPLSLVFDNPRLLNWQMKYLQVPPDQYQERFARWTDLSQKVIEPYKQYQVMLIILRKDTPIEAVCQVFEKVNKGGVSLNVFDLLTATYAAKDYELRKDWEKQEKQLKKCKVLTTIENTDFLQAITLLATRDRQILDINNGVKPDKARSISCKRKDILKLNLDEYKTWADKVTIGFEKAAQLLSTQNIFTPRYLPYRPQLTPLAAIFAALGDKGDKAGVQKKLAQWYWCGVFGELYAGISDARFVKDLPEVLTWINNGAPEPDSITSANFAENRLQSLRGRSSAAYKGLSALLLVDGCQDLLTGKTIDVQQDFQEKLDIHHIFPKKWCEDKGIDAKKHNCIINKTVIAANTNRIISNKAPSVYLKDLQNKAQISPKEMDELLRSHVIDPSTLRKDDFDAFFQTRKEALLDRIEKAMGKPIAREIVESEDDDEEETDA